MAMFHVERFIKTLLVKGFFVFLVATMFASCITPRHTVEVGDYLLLDNGKQILGHEKGLTCFFFENDQKKMPFREFLIYKYHLGDTEYVSYNVSLEGKRFKVFLYSNDELLKYYDLSEFMISNIENETSMMSTANFLGISVIDEYNNDCLVESSLFKNMVINYLRELKYEFYNTI